MRVRAGLICLLSAALLPAASVLARTIPVPTQQYPTIAAGLTAAVAGDTVAVASGTYFEHSCVLVLTDLDGLLFSIEGVIG